MRFRSLASRLVAVGLLQLLLLAVTAAAIFVLEGPHGPARPEAHLGPEALRGLEARADQPVELQLSLAALAEARIEISIYDAQRRLVASNVDPPLSVPARPLMPRGPGQGPPPFEGPMPEGPPGVPPPRGAPPPGRPPAWVVPFHVHGGQGFLVARGAHRGPGLVAPVLTLACGGLILILGALGTARWIVRPLERLSQTARAMGAGELSARSGLARSDEIGELGLRLDEMGERIQRLLTTEKELLANVAHELRTPLSRIGVALDLAREGDGEVAQGALAEIAVDVTELGGLVEDLLTATRFELGVEAQLPLRPQPTAPEALAAEAAARMGQRHRGRALRLSCPDGLPRVNVDPALFRRVLDNLLDNAHKYSPEPEAIELSVAREGAQICFEVADRGIGISEADLPRVFTPFFRGDRSRSRAGGGVGLGLTLVKRLVEAQGGTVSLAQRPGGGTTARVLVPVADGGRNTP